MFASSGISELETFCNSYKRIPWSLCITGSFLKNYNYNMYIAIVDTDRLSLAQLSLLRLMRPYNEQDFKIISMSI